MEGEKKKKRRDKRRYKRRKRERFPAMDLVTREGEELKFKGGRGKAKEKEKKVRRIKRKVEGKELLGTL